MTNEENCHEKYFKNAKESKDRLLKLGDKIQSLIEMEKKGLPPPEESIL